MQDGLFLVRVLWDWWTWLLIWYLCFIFWDLLSLYAVLGLLLWRMHQQVLFCPCWCHKKWSALTGCCRSIMTFEGVSSLFQARWSWSSSSCFRRRANCCVLTESICTFEEYVVVLPDFFLDKIVRSFGVCQSKRFNDKFASESTHVYLSFCSYGRGWFEVVLMEGAESISSSSVIERILLLWSPLRLWMTPIYLSFVMWAVPLSWEDLRGYVQTFQKI